MVGTIAQVSMPNMIEAVCVRVIEGKYVFCAARVHVLREVSLGC